MVQNHHQMVVVNGSKSVLLSYFSLRIINGIIKFIKKGEINMESNKFGPAVSLALIASVVGGIIWGLIAIYANYEIGVVAWAIGLMAGYAVTMPSKENITTAHNLVAVISSLIGIILGKYLFFAYQFSEAFIDVRMFSWETISAFPEYFDILFGMMDIVFILLAVVTAWQIPARIAAQHRMAMAAQEAELQVGGQPVQQQIAANDGMGHQQVDNESTIHNQSNTEQNQSSNQNNVQ